MDSPSPAPPNFVEPHIAQVDPPHTLRPLVVPAVIVVVALVIAAFLLAHFGKIAPVAQGTVLKETVYPVVVDSEPSQAGPGMTGAAAEQDELIVLLQVQVKNVGKKPLTIFDLLGNVTLPASHRQSFAALPEDIDRVMTRFPNLTYMQTQPLARHQVVAPGQTAQGLVVFNYPLTKDEWDKRKAAQITISFERGRSLTVPLQ